jgi:hypothetical protein
MSKRKTKLKKVIMHEVVPSTNVSEHANGKESVNNTASIEHLIVIISKSQEEEYADWLFGPLYHKKTNDEIAMEQRLKKSLPIKYLKPPMTNIYSQCKQDKLAIATIIGNSSPRRIL